jgi:hypothetical protein
MANWNYDALIRDGWTYNAQRNGFERPKTISGNVGGTVFVPFQRPTAPATPVTSVARAAQALASGGISTTVRSPMMGMPAMGAPVQIERAPTVRARTVDESLGNFALPEWNVGDVKATAVDPFSVADRDVLRELEQQAEAELALGGRLSAQEERQAQQAARAAFAARGMAHGNPAAVAEVMARDQYARQRQGDRRTFAQGIASMLSANDQAEAERADRVALANQGASLEAARVNQSAGISRWTTEGQAQQAQAQTRTQIALANAEAKLRADLANATNEGERQRLMAQLNETVAARNQAAQLQVGQANANFALQAGQANQAAGLQMLRLGYEDQWQQNNNAATWRIDPQGYKTNQAIAANNVAEGRPADARQWTDIMGVTRWTSGPRRLGT